MCFRINKAYKNYTRGRFSPTVPARQSLPFASCCQLQSGALGTATAKRLGSILFALAVAITTGVSRTLARSHASAGFEKLQSLVGDWEGTDNQGKPAQTRFKRIAGNTAVMETLTASGMDEMVTIYSVDGNAIALEHYCPTDNRPRMRALPPPAPILELVFQFQGAGNLPTLAIGHEHKLQMEFRDQDHVTERWTWRQNGRDTETVYRFARQPEH